MRLLPLVIIALLLFQPALKSQPEKKEVINWLTIEEALAKSRLKKMKIMMFIYTDWCEWCKKMEITTLADENIATYINNNYYPVKFNAETREYITFNEKEYSFREMKPKGMHSLAIEVMNGRINFPTLSFFDENWEPIQSLPNYQNQERFEKVITYFAGNHYKTIPWSSYEDYYIPFSEQEDR